MLQSEINDRASIGGRFGQPRPPGRSRGPVICAIDGDALAPDVLATATALAERLDAPLTVVHSPHPDPFLTGEPYRDAMERGHALVDRLTQDYRVDERVVEVDEPARLISALAREGASMIVLGTRGRTGLRAAILGSVSQAVIAGAPAPVVTVSALASGALERLQAARVTPAA
jgi:nucleotide-binding universal stress UspA family protein